MSKHRALLYSGIIFTTFLWGLTFVFYKIAFESFNPITIIFSRLLISSSLLYLFSVVTGRMQKIKKKDLRYFILLAFFEPFIYFLGESFGLTFISATLGSIIVSLIPLIVPIAAYFFFREKLTVVNIGGLIISFLGVVLVVLANGVEFGATLIGILLMFLAVIGAVGYVITVKVLTRRYNGFTITCYQNGIGLFFFLPLFLIFDLPDLNFQFSLNSLLAILYLAIFGSAVAFIIFTRAIKVLGPSKANIFSNLIPVFTAIFSSLLLKEEMTVLKITGIIIVLIGLILSQVKTINLRKQKYFISSTYQYPP